MTSNGKKTSILAEVLPTLEGELSSSGLIVNDPMGLCIAAEGSLGADTAGVYTNLLHLASQLPSTRTMNDPELHPTTAEDNPVASKPISSIITIEMDDSSISIKNCDGYTLALQLSNSTTTGSTTSTVSSATATATSNVANHVVPSSDPAHAHVSASSSMEADGPSDPSTDRQ